MFRARIPNFKTTHTLLLPGSLIVELLSGTALRAVAAAGSFTLTGSFNTARYGHTAILLQNGEVLVTGGVDVTGNPTASAELHNPNYGQMDRHRQNV